MNPEPRKSKQPAAAPQPTAAILEIFGEAPARSFPVAPPKPPPVFPHQVPLESGLSDYGMWIAMFAHAETSPLPKGHRRGRIWA